MFRALVGAATIAVILACGVCVRGQQTTPPKPPATVNYDEFMQLSVKQRQERFRQIGAENQAGVVRTHAERWFAKNFARLQPHEVPVFQEAIAFITPQLYEQPLNPKVMKAARDVKGVGCRVSPIDVRTAFDVFGQSAPTRPPVRWSYLGHAQCWFPWFAESIVDYIPTIPQ